MKIKLLPCLFLVFCNSAFAGDRFDRCLVSGSITSNIKIGFRNDIEWISKIQSFKFHVSSVEGTETNSKKWCKSMLQKRMDSKSNIKVSVTNPRESSPALKNGMNLVLVWAYTDYTLPVETFTIKAKK